MAEMVSIMIELQQPAAAVAEVTEILSLAFGDDENLSRSHEAVKLKVRKAIALMKVQGGKKHSVVQKAALLALFHNNSVEEIGSLMPEDFTEILSTLPDLDSMSGGQRAALESSLEAAKHNLMKKKRRAELREKMSKESEELRVLNDLRANIRKICDVNPLVNRAVGSVSADKPNHALVEVAIAALLKEIRLIEKRRGVDATYVDANSVLVSMTAPAGSPRKDKDGSALPGLGALQRGSDDEITSILRRLAEQQRQQLALERGFPTLLLREKDQYMEEKASPTRSEDGFHLNRVRSASRGEGDLPFLQVSLSFRGVIELWGLLLYIGGVLFHVE